MRGQRMPVSNKKEAFVAMLEFDPVFHYAVIMA